MQTLLFIALVIAILLDIIRICQYIGMRKLLDKDAQLLAKTKFEKKIKQLEKDWAEDRNDDSMLADYIINHWEDEQV